MGNDALLFSAAGVVQGNCIEALPQPWQERGGIGQSETELASLPLTVEQGAIGKATVQKLEKLDEKTVLHYEVTGPLPGDQAGVIGLVQNGKALERKSLKFVGKNGEAYSYVQEFSPLDKEQPLHLTTYTMPQIEFYKELEMRIPIR